MCEFREVPCILEPYLWDSYYLSFLMSCSLDWFLVWTSLIGQTKMCLWCCWGIGGTWADMSWGRVNLLFSCPQLVGSSRGMFPGNLCIFGVKILNCPALVPPGFRLSVSATSQAWSRARPFDVRPLCNVRTCGHCIAVALSMSFTLFSVLV